MEAKRTTALPQLLKENEQSLLTEWLKSQKKSGALRSGQISEADLGENSSRLLAALREGVAAGQLLDITTPPWDRTGPCWKRCRGLAPRSV